MPPEAAEAVRPEVVSIINVRVGYLPGVIHTIALDGGRTVKDAVGAAELNAEGREIRLNGKVSTMDAALNEGDQVFLMKPLKGN